MIEKCDQVLSCECEWKETRTAREQQTEPERC